MRRRRRTRPRCPTPARRGRLTAGYPGSVTGAAETEPASKGERRPFCAAASGARNEPLTATASRIDHWILVEYRGAWARDLLGGSLLSPRSRRICAHSSRRCRTRACSSSSVPTPACARAEGVLRDVEARRGAALRAGASSTGRPARRRPRRRCSPARVRRAPVAELAGRSRGLHARQARPVLRAARSARSTTRSARRGARRRVWQSTHVGGDRFAGNVVCFRTASTTGASSPADAPASSLRRRPVGSTSTRYRGRSAYRSPCRRPSARFARATGCSGSTTSSSPGRRAMRRRLAGSLPHAGRRRSTSSTSTPSRSRRSRTYLTCECDRASPRPPLAR